MFFFTRMGWLVLPICFGSVAIAAKFVPQIASQYGPGPTLGSLIFGAAAALASPVLFVTGKLLNRHKVARQIRRFGKEKTVYWGPHTFQTLPIEYWAIIIPLGTMAAFAIVPFADWLSTLPIFQPGR